MFYHFRLVASPMDPDETLTPPPKEFKRMNSQRKTMRAARCMSTIVTEKERALLIKKQVKEMDFKEAIVSRDKEFC